MTQEPADTLPRYCPRCGGLMAKPGGSQLYWHADPNHPRCDITNIADPLTPARPGEATSSTSTEPPEPSRNPSSPL
jgi:hypothetical protein